MERKRSFLCYEYVSLAMYDKHETQNDNRNQKTKSMGPPLFSNVLYSVPVST